MDLGTDFLPALAKHKGKFAISTCGYLRTYEGLCPIEAVYLDKYGHLPSTAVQGGIRLGLSSQIIGDIINGADYYIYRGARDMRNRLLAVLELTEPEYEGA